MIAPLVLVATLVLLGPQPTGGDTSAPRGLMKSGLSMTPDLGVMQGRSPGGGAFRSVSFSGDAGPALMKTWPCCISRSRPVMLCDSKPIKSSIRNPGGQETGKSEGWLTFGLLSEDRSEARPEGNSRRHLIFPSCLPPFLPSSSRLSRGYCPIGQQTQHVVAVGEFQNCAPFSSADAGPLTPGPSPRWGEGDRTTRGLGLQNPIIGSNGRTAPTAHFARRGQLGADASSSVLHPAALPLALARDQGPGVLADRPASAAGPAREALREGSYPWYDSEADRVRPVWPQQLSWAKWLGKKLERIGDAINRFFRRFNLGRSGRAGGAGGESLGTLLLVLVLIAFFVFLIVLAYHLGPRSAHRREERARLGALARLADLPEGMGTDGGDPWAEAMRRKAAGDLAGAVICLFAHQLLSLDRLGLIRLVPGLTGRQYVRGLRDPELAECVRSTLALFEWVYYGRRMPTAKAFDDVWRRALVFDARARGLGASP
jgi:hypothetical protein